MRRSASKWHPRSYQVLGRCAVLALSVALLSSVRPLGGEPPTSPEELLERVVAAWEQRDVDAYAELLAEDFAVISSSAAGPRLLDRAAELGLMDRVLAAAARVQADMAISDQWPVEGGLVLLAQVELSVLDTNGDGFWSQVQAAIQLEREDGGLRLLEWRDPADMQGGFGADHWCEVRRGFAQAGTAAEATTWGCVKGAVR